MNKIEYKFYTVLIVIFLTITFLQFNKFYNFNYNHFDLGVELHDTYQVFIGNFENIFQGHIKPLKLVLALIFYLDNIYLEFLLFSIIQSFLILSPIFFLKKNILNILYLSNPVTWIFLLGDFHYDFFLIPMFFFTFYLGEKNTKYYFFSIFFGLVKEVYLIFPFMIGLYFYFKKKEYYFLLLTFLSGVFFLIFYYIIFGNLNLNFHNEYSRQEQILSFNIKSLYFYLLICINIILLKFNYKNKLFLLFFFTLIPIYFAFSLNGFRLGFFSHYHLPYFIILFFFADCEKLSQNYKFRVIFSILILSFISVSPVSYFFWSKKIDFPFSVERYFEKLDDKKYIYSQLNLKEKKVAISNNFLIPHTIKSKKLLSFDMHLNLKNIDYVILSKKVVSLGASTCINLNNCFFEDRYNLKYKELKDNFQLIFESDNYNIFEKKR